MKQNTTFPEKIADNARMKRWVQSQDNSLQFNSIPHDSLDGLILRLPNGKSYVPMDAAQLEARIIEARISNSFIQPSTHPLICKAIDAAQTHMKQYEAVNRTVVDKYVVELVKHPKANTPILLRCKFNGRYYYVPTTEQFMTKLAGKTFRKAVMNFLIDKVFS